jgi:hypothetical protein
MATYIVRSVVVIETVVEFDDMQDQVYRHAGDEAADQISQLLKDVEFDFCDDYDVYDQEGNQIEES